MIKTPYFHTNKMITDDNATWQRIQLASPFFLYQYQNQNQNNIKINHILPIYQNETYQTYQTIYRRS